MSASEEGGSSTEEKLDADESISDLQSEKPAFTDNVLIREVLSRYRLHRPLANKSLPARKGQLTSSGQQVPLESYNKSPEASRKTPSPTQTIKKKEKES